MCGEIHYFWLIGKTVCPLMRENYLPIAKIAILLPVQARLGNLWDYLQGLASDSQSLGKHQEAT